MGGDNSCIPETGGLQLTNPFLPSDLRARGWLGSALTSLSRAAVHLGGTGGRGGPPCAPFVPGCREPAQGHPGSAEQQNSGAVPTSLLACPGPALPTVQEIREKITMLGSVQLF